MLLNACTTWHPVAGSIPTAIETTQAEVLRVERHDGRVIRLWDAHVVNDSLWGTERHPIRGKLATADERARGYQFRIVTMPISDVRSVSVSRTNKARTAAVVVGTLVVAVFTVGLIGWGLSEDGGFGGFLAPSAR
jgi:hypothetical protein